MNKTELELAIDAYGLCAILEAMSEICDAKGEHITASYDDQPLARHWQKASFLLAEASAKIDMEAHGVQLGHDKNEELPA